MVNSSHPLASWLSLPHYSVRLTPPDPDTPVKSQQWLPRGATGVTIHFSTFLFSPLPLLTQIHSTFLSSYVLTRLFFFSLPSWPCILLCEVIMPWLSKELVGFHFFPTLLPFNTTIVHAGRGKYQQQWKTLPSQQLLGGGHWQISLTQKTELLITTHMLKCFIWTKLNAIVRLGFLAAYLPSAGEGKTSVLSPVVLSEQGEGGEKDRTPTVTCCL